MGIRTWTDVYGNAFYDGTITTNSGVVTPGLQIATLSGVLKATAGIVSGSATCDDILDGATYVRSENNLSAALKSNYDAAYVHKSSSGTDHSFINQAVTIAGTPTFAEVFLTDPILNSSQAATKGYVDTVATGLDFKASVLDFFDPTGGLPAGPGLGDRYISLATANGWTINEIYQYNGATWDLDTIEEGSCCYVDSLNILYVFNGLTWVKFASIVEHNALNGLDGGTPGEFYHLTNAQHTNLVLPSPSFTSVGHFDADASNSLFLLWNEGDTVNRTLNVLVNASDRNIDLSDDLTVSAGCGTLDQNVSATGNPAYSLISLNDLNLSNLLSMTWDEDDTVNRALKFKVNTAGRTIDLSANLTVSAGCGTLDQSVSTSGAPSFVTAALQDTNLSNKLTVRWGENDTVDRTLDLRVNAAARIIELSGDLTVSAACGTLNQSVATTGSPSFVGVTASGRIQGSMGIAVGSANDLTLGTDGNVFSITGAVQINAIITTNWQAGSEIILIFAGAPTIKHNTAGGVGTAPILLAGSVDFSAAANSVLKLVYDGTQWQEVSRKVA